MQFADVAELADALDSGSSARKGVEVQVLSSALVIFGVSRYRGKPRFFMGHPRGHPTDKKRVYWEQSKKHPAQSRQ